LTRVAGEGEARYGYRDSEEVFGIKKWEAEVVRNYNVAFFLLKNL
jgi:Na+-transporting NADH:ubiquinone oxidoreductase subunit NqrF